MEMSVWDSSSLSYLTVVCDSTTASLWWSRFTALDTRWRNETMHDAVDKQLLSYLVKLTTILREMPKEELIATLDQMEDIELQYLDLLLHDLSSALWNSNYHTEIQESWTTEIMFEPTISPE